MYRIRQYAPLVFLLLVTAAICGKLLITPVWHRVTQATRYVRGWPWPYQEFWEGAEPPGLFTKLTSDSLRFDVGVLLADIGVTFAIAILMVLFLVHHRLRHGRWFRFSLRGLLALTCMCALIFALWAGIHREWVHEEAIIEKWNQWPTTMQDNWTCTSRGPEWLRRLLLWNDPDIFKRIGYLSVHAEEYNQPNFEAEFAPAIGELRYLKHLSFDVGARKPVHLLRAECLSHVPELWFHPAAVDDGTLEWVGKLAGLKDLTIGGFFYDPVNTTDDALANLANCHELESFAIFNPTFTGSGLSQLATLRNFRTLRLNEFRMSDIAMSAIVKIQSLEALGFGSCDFNSVSDLKSFARLPNLHAIEFRQCELTDQQLESVADSSGVTHLILERCAGLTDHNIHYLSQLPLRELYLTDSDVGDHAIEVLNEMPKLEILHIEGCPGISDEGVLRLRGSRPLKEIKVRPGQFKEETLKRLESYTSHLWVW